MTSWQVSERRVTFESGVNVAVKKNTKFTRAAIKKLKEAKIDRLPMEVSELIGKVSAEDVVDRETGEVLLKM